MASIPIEIDGIDHVVLRVTDLQRTLHFYVDVLGLTLERILESANLYQLRCGRNLIDIVPLPPGTPLANREQRGIDHLCLNVRGNMDALVDYMKAHGVTITLGPMELYGATGFGTSIYVLDPDEHTVELKANYARRPLRFKTATVPAAAPEESR